MKNSKTIICLLIAGIVYSFIPVSVAQVECPDLVWSELNITQITSSSLYYSYVLKNIGNDTAVVNKFGLQNYYSYDGITKDDAAGGAYLYLYVDSTQILPGGTLSYEYHASGNSSSFSYLIVEIFGSAGNECSTENNLISKLIALDTAVVADFESDITTNTVPFTVHFADLPTGSPTHWEWDFNDDGITDSYEQNPEWTFDTSGDYSISLTASKAGFTDKELKNDYITANAVVNATKDIKTDDWNVYPNPAIDFIQITGNNITWVTIYDISGNLVAKVPANNETNIRLDINDLEAGLYFTKISGKEKNMVSRFVKY